MALLYNNYENNMKINAVSGTLTKTYKDSYFVRFQKESQMEANYINDKKSFRTDGYNNIEVVVLQIMICGNDTFLIEAIDKEKYEKMFVNVEGEQMRPK